VSQESEGCGALLAKAFIAVGLGIIQTIASGYVLAQLWVWFIAPKFAAVPALSFVDCIGVSLTINVVLFGIKSSITEANIRLRDIKENEAFDSKEWGYMFLRPAVKLLIAYPLILLAGYVWHRFV
jgi:hypothetical protein